MLKIFNFELYLNFTILFYFFQLLKKQNLIFFDKIYPLKFNFYVTRNLTSKNLAILADFYNIEPPLEYNFNVIFKKVGHFWLIFLFTQYFQLKILNF